MLDFFREKLKQEMRERSTQNPAYSLRAFARDLGVNSSFLTAVINGKRGLSRATATELALKLQLPESQSELFCNSAEAHHGRSKNLRSHALKKLTASQTLRQLSAQDFAQVQEWYYFAIRELVRLRDFVADPTWIAQRLNLSNEQAAIAWKKLRALDLIVQDDAGRWSATEYVASPDGTPNPSLKNVHRKLMEKSQTSLETQSLDERNHSAVLFPFHVSQIKEAKALIQEFRRSFEQKLQPAMNAEADRVYCLSVHLFAIDEKIRGEKHEQQETNKQGP